MVGSNFPYLSPLLVIVVWWLPLKALLPHLEFYYLLTVEVVFKAALFLFAVLLLFSVLIRLSSLCTILILVYGFHFFLSDLLASN